jgi:anti-sigma regulatory factor (Ser/Thr protein kinase)
MSGRAGAVSEHARAGSAEHESGTGLASHNWPRASTLPLAALETAPGCGRGHARNLLREWGLSHFADDAALLVSELLTNAVAAGQAGDPVCLRLLADHDQLIIEAWDRAPGLPRPRQASDGDEGGRGLAVIEAVATRWGHQRASSGWKVIWAELRTGNGRD